MWSPKQRTRHTSDFVIWLKQVVGDRQLLGLLGWTPLQDIQGEGLLNLDTFSTQRRNIQGPRQLLLSKSIATVIGGGGLAKPRLAKTLPRFEPSWPLYLTAHSGLELFFYIPKNTFLETNANSLHTLWGMFSQSFSSNILNSPILFVSFTIRIVSLQYCLCNEVYCPITQKKNYYDRTNPIVQLSYAIRLNCVFYVLMFFSSSKTG